MAVLEAGEKLSKQACDTTNVGEMLFVMDSSAAFVCDGKSWQTLKGDKGEDGGKGNPGKDGDNGTGCTSKSVKNAAGLEGLEVTCGETVIDTIWNGKDGENGNNGTNCTATVNQDGGFDIVCDGQTVGTIKNGEDGVGCTLDDEGDGTVKVTCGEGDDETITNIYKAVCGTVAYDPAKSFCSEGKLYSCGDKPYDPKTQYCLKVTRDETDIYSVEDLLTDARDEQNIQVYKTVKICNADKTSCQTWMAENLNYAYTGVQSWCGGGEIGTTIEGDCSVYGRLYTWAAAVGKSEDDCGYGHVCDLSDVKNENGEVRGICPEGWHVPTNDEFTTLYDNVDAINNVGKMLKSTSGWEESGNGTDEYGFSALSAGYRFHDGEFYSVGDHAGLWSASESNSTSASYQLFYYNNDLATQDSDHKRFGHSLRCLKDKAHLQQN